ncbi:MAG: S41 family peptidase, partial [Elusimicrobiales bacterium]|nr:S41 family peptidase [Elusimicrobiales bacterium]
MKRTLLCALAAFACACSTESRTDEKILEAFEKHSYELHDSGELAAELKARGPGVLRFFDPRAALLGAPRGLKVKAPREGRLYSTGMLLGPCGTSACVIRVLRGSPAANAGVKDYERIVSAGGSGGAAGEVLDALGKGASGLVLAGRGGERALSLPAPSFRAPPVFGLYDPATRTAYLRVAVFSKGVAAQVAKGLAAFKAADPRAIVLDLRYSIGGVPEEAAAVFRLFAGRGAECFAIRSRHKGYSVDFPAADGGPFSGRPLA